MIEETQMTEPLRAVLADQLAIYKKGATIEQRNIVPDTRDIPIEDARHWLKIPNIICVFVDMQHSTQLSATNHDVSTAAIYQFYTGTAVRVFGEFDSPYIDVRGDGAFALFDGDQPHRALAAAVSFKTFVSEVFIPEVKSKTSLEIGSHCGIDQKTVLVRKVGYKRSNGRSDRQNEVWAGKPVNMAAKLASLSENKELLASDRYYGNLKSKEALRSCGCPSGEIVDLWEKRDISTDTRFDFDSAFCLKSIWCKTHGKEFCEKLLDYDDK